MFQEYSIWTSWTNYDESYIRMYLFIFTESSGLDTNGIVLITKAVA